MAAGHDILMATMLNGAAVMDGALLLIAANETCPQPQTSEHLAAVEIMRLEHIIILQNKIDLIRCAPCFPVPSKISTEGRSLVKGDCACDLPPTLPFPASSRLLKCEC